MLWVDDVPANGLRVLRAYDTRMNFESSFPARSAPDLPDAPSYRAASCEEGGGVVVMTNDIVDVRVCDGRVDIAMGARKLIDALSLETVRDEGDSYTASLRGAPQRLTMLRARAGARGPLRASVVIDWEYVERRRPQAVADVAGYVANSRVRRYNARIRVRTVLILDAEASHLRCDVTVDNRARDHRLQLVFNSDVAREARVWADAAFCAVERRPITAPPSAAETPPTTMPMHRWATSSDELRGATIFSDGLAEAEVARGRMAVTLVRAVGELSRQNLPERPGHAGWPMPISRAQCQGVTRARVGLLLHPPYDDRTRENIEDCVDALLLPLAGETWRDLENAEQQVAGPELFGKALRGSSVTLNKSGNALILRAINTSSDTVDGYWRMPFDGPWRATVARLDETALSPHIVSARDVPIKIPPFGLSTVRIERDGG